MEIGCGKGKFACDMSKKYPDVNFIAVEKVPDVCCIALEKAMAAKESRPADNLRFLIGDARNLTEWFLPHSVDTLYLNFSDPWPKAGHAKRRLTYRAFLEVYFSLLKPDGVLALKTDNEGLFLFTQEELSALGYVPHFLTDDLHASEEAATNIMTEYERSFSEQGMKIHALRVTGRSRQPVTEEK